MVFWHSRNCCVMWLNRYVLGQFFPKRWFSFPTFDKIRECFYACCWFIQKQMHLGKSSKIRPFYEKAPFYIDFRIYVFNVTNKDEVLKGSEYEIFGFLIRNYFNYRRSYLTDKPKVKEIGPYFFEWDFDRLELDQFLYKTKSKSKISKFFMDFSTQKQRMEREIQFVWWRRRRHTQLPPSR